MGVCAMTMSNTAAGSMQSEINITPMIDVLLVLLIIFMVIVPVLPKGEAASAPQPARSDAHTQDAVVLEILNGTHGNAEFRINQQEVSRQDLPARLAAIFANRAQRVIFIKGDDQLSFTQVAEAIDISHAAGVDRVGLITPKVSQGL
jgi:biopolymer transport protein TolR